MDILFIIGNIVGAFIALLAHDKLVEYKKKEQNISKVLSRSSKNKRPISGTK